MQNMSTFRTFQMYVDFCTCMLHIICTFIHMIREMATYFMHLESNLYVSVFQVICSVVGHYVDKVSEHLPDLVGELEQVYTLCDIFESQ